MSLPLVAGIELGGTKAIATLAHGTDIVDEFRVPTTMPDETLRALANRLDMWCAAYPVAAIGIASFGPVALDPKAPDYGSITSTPKPGWAGARVVGRLTAGRGLPVAFDTDVNGAALAEGRWGASMGCSTHIYLTIGTGIGGGVVINGRPVHGLVHPEIGHIRVRRRPGDGFAGVCPFHGDCLEGISSGPAIAARAGMPGAKVPPDHPLWADIADALAELMATLVLTVSPERILIGGGVGQGNPGLLPVIRARTIELLNTYVAGIDADAIIRSPALGDRAGPLGSIALGLLALAT